MQDVFPSKKRGMAVPMESGPPSPWGAGEKERNRSLTDFGERSRTAPLGPMGIGAEEKRRTGRRNPLHDSRSGSHRDRGSLAPLRSGGELFRFRGLARKGRGRIYFSAVKETMVRRRDILGLVLVGLLLR